MAADLSERPPRAGVSGGGAKQVARHQARFAGRAFLVERRDRPLHRRIARLRLERIVGEMAGKPEVAGAGDVAGVREERRGTDQMKKSPEQSTPRSAQ